MLQQFSLHYKYTKIRREIFTNETATLRYKNLKTLGIQHPVLNTKYVKFQIFLILKINHKYTIMSGLYC